MGRASFASRSGHELTGSLELPPGGEWKATALFAHCFTCGRNIRAARDITRALAAAGFAVLRFDFTGLGDSEGEFEDTTFSSNLDDLEDAATWLGETLAAPQLLVGHSLGGTAALAVAERLDSVRAVATLAAPAQPEHVLKNFGDDLARIEEEGSAEVDLGGRPFRVRRDFIDDARSHDLSARLRKLRRALLVMHAPGDRVVAIDQAETIFTSALHPKSFVSLDEADHLLSRSEDSVYAASVIASWAAKYLEMRSAQATEGVVVAGRTADAFLCSVQAGEHRLLADEPESHGGSDLGLDPYRFLSAALASCTVMTLNMYARHKKLAVERVLCQVTHRKVHASDCEDCETREGKLDELRRVVTIEGELDDAQRARMLEIADRCPVHRTLEGEIKVRSELA
ncbi:MAG: OsmC family protein [Gammaproteobacteria bacterium]|nr:MAG: OsmC family protein [Gammaproteobacteria bacterium]